MFNNLSKYNIILASNSPRRRELLSQLGIMFTVKTINGIDESYPADLKGEAVALHIASSKARAYKQCMAPNDLIITADTIVCVGDDILGKPKDKADAIRMLQELSGRQHEVITAVAITTATRTETFAVTTLVRFAQLDAEIIEHYVDHYKPYDKAGSYGIQEWIGYVGVEEIHGSFFNVIGLPVQRLFKALQKF